MSIDDAIEFERYLSKQPEICNEDFMKCEEHKQIAEWLEELKEARKGFEENRKAGYSHGYADGYAKAISNFYDEVLNFEDYIEPKGTSEFGTVLLYSGKDITNMIVKIAEQLKGVQE